MDDNQINTMQKESFIDNCVQGLVKYGSLIGLILIGLMGMFSYDLLHNRKFTMSYVIGATGIAVFGGYVGGTYVLNHFPDQAPWMIPMLTILSNNIVSAFMAIDYKSLMEGKIKEAFSAVLRIKKEE